MQPAIELAAPPNLGVSTAGRVLSLDVFRGATIASMILVNDPGSWNAVYAPLLHAEWHGWTFTDTVFPLFLWIAGVSLTLSFARRVERGDDRRRLLLHVLRRSGLIFALGLFLNAMPRFDFSTLRIPGVLQRIAICYVIAATIFLFTKTARARILWIAGLLAAYWVLMMGAGAGVLTPEENLSARVDRMLLSGHMYSQTKTWDPEGTISTLPSIATVLFGVLCGMLLRARLTEPERTAWMFLAGNLLIFAGLMLSTWMPINKKIWTTPFSVFMAGLAFVVFAAWYWLIEVQGWRRGTRALMIYGMNAIAVYVFAGVLSRLLSMTGAGAWLWTTVYAPLAPAKLASLLFAITFVLVCYSFAWMLYKRNWFVRL
ncbi:MAG TPA: heparan-alpha-glucosaminide N-acetyltransferase domain-containing protein [Bryobacteraceae bacterium]|nr:heparan-alpha-glucosaminide N-acetyltransferase domain-containing protein [Bryobacteraceae bacterium]